MLGIRFDPSLGDPLRGNPKRITKNSGISSVPRGEESTKLAEFNASHTLL
jgi:hypothetical protein